MIRTVGDLLDEIRKQEQRILDATNPGHPGLVGDMYEGLTAALAQLALPGDCDLKIKSGIIENDDGVKSGQIDCMLVSGDGLKIPYSAKGDEIVNLSQVIAVIEVTKTGDKDKIFDAVEHLGKLYNLLPASGILNFATDEACSRIIGVRPSLMADPFGKSRVRNQIMAQLCMDANLPVRIVLAYNGAAKEVTLREHVTNAMKGISGVYAPALMPNLCIVGKNSCMKLNGLPYGNEWQEDVWMFSGTTTASPLYLLLQVLWTRLDIKGLTELPVFAQDDADEQFNPLFSVTYSEKDPPKYFVYKADTQQLKGRSGPVAPEAVILEDWQTPIILGLIRGNSVVLSDVGFQKLLLASGCTLEDAVERLVSTKLVFEDNGELHLRGSGTRMAFLPDGTSVAGEDARGRFSRALVGDTNMKGHEGNSVKMLHFVVDPRDESLLSTSTYDIPVADGVIQVEQVDYFRYLHQKAVHDFLLSQNGDVELEP